MHNLAMFLKHAASEVLANLSIRGPFGSFDERSIDALNTDGLFKVDDFLSEDTCREVISRIQQIERNRPGIFSRESNGADTRLYGIDRVSDLFRLEKETAELDRLAEAFHKGKDIVQFQMAGHIKYAPDNLGSGAGWHRDSPFSQQFKFLIYLNDVSEENGPFQYIPGSHRRGTIARYSRSLGCALSQHRFADAAIIDLECAGILRSRLTLTGAAGTLLVANVKGLHRGMPLKSGDRWALTRYYYKQRIPPAMEASLPEREKAAHPIRV